MADPYQWPELEYCEEAVEVGGNIQKCDTPLDSQGRCPHGRNHVDE